ncbi:PREDICTED: F-box/kelch-repeat protein At3g04660-like [Camelina sativa]|uniref:F-box/kelch-repeat protein At3g04660-like n=1 Tax=Camelina sativa TaxID=90675 RepID=A0ABM1RLI2_CAMSA|nr:PREDICTED: F-box/kelch-repeat protein At3g04660-like [Camelina sativa]
MKKRGRKCKNTEEQRDEEHDPCSIIALELKVEILMKLLPESIARLGFVSNHWSSIIRGKDFTDLYQTRSSSQPRLLFAVYRRNTQKHFFHSCSQEDPSSDHSRVSYTLNSDLRYCFNPPIGGFIFGRNGTKAIIGNPSTGQFVSLPRVKTNRKNIFSVFGYEPVNDLYKVLCMTVITKRGSQSFKWEDPFYEEPMTEEHQVLTVGPKQKWRMLECKFIHRHHSGSPGICRNGVVYYLASLNDEKSLVSFDLRSEDFNVSKLPEDYILQQFGNLVNHSGKIAIVCHGYSGPMDLWVLEDATKEEWSKFAAVIPSIKDIYGNDQKVMFCGILATGETILAPIPSPNPFFFICYDPKEKDARKVVIEGIGDDSAVIRVFFDHVESHMVLPKVR